MAAMKTEQRMRLVATARAAAARARARHSGFRVGAAVLDEQGQIHPGCNVESDSYGLTMCAERVAIFAALAASASRLIALAISCPDAPPEPPAARMPCGACRQIMVEYLAPEATVIVDGLADFQPPEVLPDAFRLTQYRG